MKRLTAILALVLLATTALAQEEKKEKPEEYNNVREFRNKVFEVRHRTPRELLASITFLTSGFKGAGLNTNNELRTITVRDFPENIAAIEEAIKRLDRPADVAPAIDMRISVLIASKTPLSNAGAVPDELAPVVKQLQSTLRYAHYGLMATTVNRTTKGRGVDGSGVADATLLGITPNHERPIFYRYKLREITTSAGVERATIDIAGFEFSMNVPIVLGGTGGVQYQSVGFDTPVKIRENEKVVIGTTTMGDKALIVVVTATMEK